MTFITYVFITVMTSWWSVGPLLTYIHITLSWNVIFSSKYYNEARIQKIWNLYKIINFQKIFRCFQQNSHCRTSESCRALKISQNISNRYKLKVTKAQPTPVYTFWNCSKSLTRGEGDFTAPPSPYEVEIGLMEKKTLSLNSSIKM